MVRINGFKRLEIVVKLHCLLYLVTYKNETKNEMINIVSLSDCERRRRRRRTSCLFRSKNISMA